MNTGFFCETGQRAPDPALFGRTARAGLAFAPQRRVAERALGPEQFGVIFAGFGQQRVGGQRQLARLQPFLQAGLGVFAELVRRRQRVDGLGEPRQHHCPAGLETGIEIDRGDHRLEGVGEDRVAAVAAGFHFARAQQDARTQFEPSGERRERGFAHQFGARAGEFALRGLRPADVEGLRDDRPDQGVAEKFEPFVVDRCGAAVGQCPFQQRRVAEDMASAGHRCAHRGSDLGRAISTRPFPSAPARR
jgi:hypothetical protein